MRVREENCCLNFAASLIRKQMATVGLLRDYIIRPQNFFGQKYHFEMMRIEKLDSKLSCNSKGLIYLSLSVSAIEFANGNDKQFEFCNRNGRFSFGFLAAIRTVFVQF